MYNVLSVAIANSLENLFYYSDCVYFVEAVLFDYSVKKFASFTELCYNVESFFGLRKFEYLNDVGVVLKMRD